MSRVSAPGWPDWLAFRSDQREWQLPAGTVAHLPLGVRYIDSGTGSAGTVLLMHGIPTWGWLWNAVIPALVQAGFRVIAPDFLGHGFSDRRDCFDRSFQDQARMVCALLDHLGPGPVHVVGHDTGGAVALILAIEHAHRVDRLVIANAVCYDRFDDDMLDLGHPLRWGQRPVAELRAALEETLAAGLAQEGALTPAFREGILAPWDSEEGKLSLIRNACALNANQTMALVDRHGSIQARCLVLWGLEDPWQRAEDGRRLAGEIPGARFLGLPGVSHWLQQDSPLAVTDELLAFLA